MKDRVSTYPRRGTAGRLLSILYDLTGGVLVMEVEGGWYVRSVEQGDARQAEDLVLTPRGSLRGQDLPGRVVHPCLCTSRLTMWLAAPEQYWSTWADVPQADKRGRSVPTERDTRWNYSYQLRHLLKHWSTDMDIMSITGDINWCLTSILFMFVAQNKHKQSKRTNIIINLHVMNII